MYSRLKPDVVALNPLYSKWGTFCNTANFNNITLEPNIFVQNTIHNSFDKGCEVAACCCRLQPQKAKSFLSAPTVDGHTRQAVRLQDDFRARTRALEEQHQISHFEWKQDFSLFSLFLKASKEVLFLPLPPLLLACGLSLYFFATIEALSSSSHSNEHSCNAVLSVRAISRFWRSVMKKMIRIDRLRHDPDERPFEIKKRNFYFLREKRTKKNPFYCCRNEEQ